MSLSPSSGLTRILGNASIDMSLVEVYYTLVHLNQNRPAGCSPAR